jgi:hypothetical protein
VIVLLNLNPIPYKVSVVILYCHLEHAQPGVNVTEDMSILLVLQPATEKSLISRV